MKWFRGESDQEIRGMRTQTLEELLPHKHTNELDGSAVDLKQEARSSQNSSPARKLINQAGRNVYNSALNGAVFGVVGTLAGLLTLYFLMPLMTELGVADMFVQRRAEAWQSRERMAALLRPMLGLRHEITTEEFDLIVLTNKSGFILGQVAPGKVSDYWARSDETAEIFVASRQSKKSRDMLKSEQLATSTITHARGEIKNAGDIKFTITAVLLRQTADISDPGAFYTVKIDGEEYVVVNYDGVVTKTVDFGLEADFKGALIHQGETGYMSADGLGLIKRSEFEKAFPVEAKQHIFGSLEGVNTEDGVFAPVRLASFEGALPRGSVQLAIDLDYRDTFFPYAAGSIEIA